MRIAIFSDVHGNLPALRAVLDDIERHEVDQVVCAGDLCLVGPRPAECIRLVRERGYGAIMGNTDEWIVGQSPPPERMRERVVWTDSQLDTDERAWLARLPFSIRYSPTGRPADDLLIVHANPKDVNQIIFPSEVDQIARYGEVRQPDVELEPLLYDVNAAVIAFGHLHVPNARPWRDTLLLNVSSVSMPGNDDPSAKYAILAWVNRQWTFTHERVPYDTTDEIAAFRDRQPPEWEEAAASLEKDGTYYPQRV